MTRKTWRPAYDQWRDDYLTKAQRYVCCMFLGYGQYDKREAATLQEARILRRRMVREYGDQAYTRGVMIYAVTHDGLSIPVKD